MDVSAYLERIGLPPSTPLPTTIDTLTRLMWAHVTHVPFENLEVLRGAPVRLDLESLERKLVGARRGGYCFEHNGWLAAVLGELGFDVTMLAARVRWLAQRSPSPKTHMLLHVLLDGQPLIVDVGFGGAGPTAPLRLEPHVEQRQALDTYRLQREGDVWVLQVNNADPSQPGWLDAYAFSLEPQHAVDYEVANHYTSTHPDSRFVKGLIVTLVSERGRHVLRDDEYVLRGPRGVVVEQRTITSGDRAELLQSVFGLAPIE